MTQQISQLKRKQYGLVDQEPRGTDPSDHPGALDLMGLGEALDRLQDDGEAQRREEHSVDESPHHLRPNPAEGVFVGRLSFLGEPHRDQSHHQRDDVRQHMKGIRQHRERRGQPADHHFHNEKPEMPLFCLALLCFMLNMLLNC
uniref:Uncharacterized protein n=1 Tax=Anabas testudineus TaxID=64144 RepID=A0A3Q1ITC7_ANATE